MEREDLLSLCQQYVQQRSLLGIPILISEPDPASEIVYSFRHGDISESEKNSLLVYVTNSQNDALETHQWRDASVDEQEFF
ncbi:MAG: hypothetical protein CK530_11690 [Planctomycetaceae bacterium]|nr:MAG: hypothetical protein CK530_11690 [Planctomycetaceae bacterium]